MLGSNSSLETNGMMEHAVLFTPDKPNGSAVLFTHGYTTNSNGYNEFAEACAATGVTCLTVDLLSHGLSEGSREDLTISDYVDGLTVAYDHLAAQPQVDPNRVGTMAASFGAYLTVLLSTERPVASLLLRVPALYPDELRDVPRHDFDTDTVLHIEPNPDNKALQIVRNFIGKVVLVSSENDEIIMPSTIEAYSRAIGKGEHIQMTNATHVLDELNRVVFKNMLLKWAAEL